MRTRSAAIADFSRTSPRRTRPRWPCSGWDSASSTPRHDAAALERYSDHRALPDTPYSRKRSAAPSRRSTAGSDSQARPSCDAGREVPDEPFGPTRLPDREVVLSDKKYAEAADGFRRVTSSQAIPPRTRRSSSSPTPMPRRAPSSSRGSRTSSSSPSSVSELRPTPSSSSGPYFRARTSCGRRSRSRVKRDHGRSRRVALQPGALPAALRRPEEAKTAPPPPDHPNDKRAADVAYQLGDLHEAAGGRGSAGRVRRRRAGPSVALTTELQYRVGHSLEQQNDVDGALKAKQAVASTDRRIRTPPRSPAARRSTGEEGLLAGIPAAATSHRTQGRRIGRSRGKPRQQLQPRATKKREQCRNRPGTERMRTMFENFDWTPWRTSPVMVVILVSAC